LIESKMHMKGPFKETTTTKASKELEPWYSSIKNTSRAYTLLHDKYLFHPSRISRMSAEDFGSPNLNFRSTHSMTSRGTTEV